MLGRVQEGIAQERQAISVFPSLGVRSNGSGSPVVLAKAQSIADRLEEAMRTLAKAPAFVEMSSERLLQGRDPSAHRRVAADAGR
jgi:hypothetical protein